MLNLTLTDPHGTNVIRKLRIEESQMKHCHLRILCMYLYLGRDYSTVDGHSRLKCYLTRASCDCGRLQIGDVTREVEFLSNDYTNPNTNPKTLTTLALTLTDHHDALESFCAPVFCDFVRNYSCTVDGAVVTSLYLLHIQGKQSKRRH